MMKKFLILVVGMMILTLAGGCSPTESTEPTRRSDGRIEVQFWHAMSGAQARVLNEIIDEFNREQDQYYVVGAYQGFYPSLSQKLIASLYAKRNPAASQMYPGWTTRFLRYGYLTPVEDFIDADPEFGQEEIDDLYDNFVEENTMEIAETGERRLITLPFNKSVYVLMTNRTLMDELGWEEPPNSWDELKQLAQDMVKRSPEGDIERYGFATRPFIEAFTVFLFAAGKNHLDPQTGEPQFNSQEGLEALQYLQELVSGEDRVGYVEPSYLSNVFGTGNIGMYIGSTAAFPFNDRAVGTKFIWRAYPVPPKSPDVPGKTLSQGTNVGIFENVPAEEQQGAWEFIKYLATPKVTARWAIETGYMPIRKSAGNLPEMQEYLAENPNYGAAISTLERATFEPRVIYWESVRTSFSREVEAVLFNRRSAEEALENMLRYYEQFRKTE